jgi:hypothetical protein
MKKVLTVVAGAVLAAGLTTTGLAGDKPDLGSQAKYDQAEMNLLIGLKSDNLGLRESAADMLGEIKSDRAVIPLMKMLRDDPQESSRIVAALSLCRIGDARGVFAVKRATKFDDSKIVQQRCAWFYEQYVSPGSFQFVSDYATNALDLANK